MPEEGEDLDRASLNQFTKSQLVDIAVMRSKHVPQAQATIARLRHELDVAIRLIGQAALDAALEAEEGS